MRLPNKSIKSDASSLARVRTSRIIAKLNFASY
jgi:hypothetical protein